MTGSSQTESQVLFVTKSDLSGVGGHNIATKEIAIAFGEHPNIETTVVCPEPHEEYPSDVVEAIDDIVHFRPANTDIDALRHWESSFRLLHTLRGVFRDVNLDLVVARIAPVFFSPALLASRNDVPYVLLSRGSHYKTLRFSRVLSRLYQYNVRVANHVYTASEEIKQDTNRMRKPGQSAATVLPNAVDIDRFTPIPKAKARDSIESGLDDSSFVVGFVGTMEPYHAVEELFESAGLADVDDLEFLVVGDGSELETFRSKANRLGLKDAVHFTGFVPHEEVSTYISACDVMFGASHQGSATPIKCFEYLACERPIIVQDVADLDFVSNQNIGQQVESVSPENIAVAIEELASLDESTRSKMGKRGREFVAENHTWRSFVDRVIDDSLGENSE